MELMILQMKIFEMFFPQLLFNHNPSAPLNGEVAALMMRDRTAYEENVNEYCEKYAKTEGFAGAAEEKSSGEELREDEYAASDYEAIAGKPDL